MEVPFKAHLHGTYFFPFNCHTQHDDATLTTRIAPCKLTVQLAYDCVMHHDKMCSLLKPYDNRSHIQCYMTRVVYNFFLT